MADPKKTVNAATDNLTIANFVPKAAPAQAVSIVTDEAVYSSAVTYDDPNTKQKEPYPIDGYLLDAIPMESAKYGPFTGFRFQLVEPCAVPKSPGSTDGRLIQAGGIVILPGKTKTEAELQKYLGREKVARLWCKPLPKVKTGTGHDLEHWDIQFVSAEERAKVTASDAVIAQLGSAIEPKQLSVAS